MKIIGLTGGIASGKSTVAKMMESFGASVIDADLLAREVVLPGEPAYRALVAEFGQEILFPDGTINRQTLGSIVFGDQSARTRLEAITHPAIGRRAEERLETLRRHGTAVAVYMAALLFEAGITSRVDEVWVVYVDRDTQLRRLMERDGMSREDALRRIGAQMPMEEKARRGKVVIDNGGTLHQTEEQVRRAWQTHVAAPVR
jgi:dephospho-CoA kinase